MRKANALIILAMLTSLVLVSGCVTEQPVVDMKDRESCMLLEGHSWCEYKEKCIKTGEEECPTGGIGLPNPAAVYCIENGGQFLPITNELGTAGYCIIPGVGVCEEWEYFRSNGTVCNVMNFTSSDGCASSCVEAGYGQSECKPAGEKELNDFELGSCVIQGSGACAGEGECSCFCYDVGEE